MILMTVPEGECPIFCDGDLVTLRDVDVEAAGRVIHSDTLEYEVEFPTGRFRLSGESLILVDEELATKRAAIFRGYMMPVGGFWVKKPPFELTNATRTN